MSALPTHFPASHTPHTPELHLRAEPAAPLHSVIPNPQSEITALLSDLSSPSLSLQEVADKHNISLHGLTAWMLRPDVAEQLNSIESVGARRARLVCSVHLTEVAGALLKHIRAAESDLDPSTSTPTPTQNQLPHFSLRLRARESLRKSVSLFLRIARHHPSTKPPAPSQPPIPSSPLSSNSARRAPGSKLSSIPQSETPNPKFEISSPSETPYPPSDIAPPSAFISDLRAAEPALFQNLSDEETQAIITAAVLHISAPLTTEQIASLPDEAIFSLVLNHLRSTHSPGP